MKYKVGDRVKIKTWEEMEKEFGLDINEDIKLDNSSNVFNINKLMEKELSELDTDRVITIVRATN